MPRILIDPTRVRTRGGEEFRKELVAALMSLEELEDWFRTRALADAPSLDAAKKPAADEEVKDEDADIADDEDDDDEFDDDEDADDEEGDADGKDKEED